MTNNVRHFCQILKCHELGEIVYRVAPKGAENEHPVQHGLITVAEVYNINLCQIWPLITITQDDSTLIFSSIKINLAFYTYHR